MATRKTQQLDVNLSNVKDDAVRQALDSIVAFVNKTTQNVKTGGKVQATTVTNLAGGAGIDAINRLFAQSMQLNDGGFFKVKIFEGDLGAYGGGSEVYRFNFPTVVFGAFGVCTYNGKATNEWMVMSNTSATNNNIAFYDPGLALGLAAAYKQDSNSITILNADNVTNSYRIIVFYK